MKPSKTILKLAHIREDKLKENIGSSLKDADRIWCRVVAIMDYLDSQQIELKEHENE